MSVPWLKLLSAVGVILALIMMMMKRKSSAQHSRGDNQFVEETLTRCTAASLSQSSVVDGD